MTKYHRHVAQKRHRVIQVKNKKNPLLVDRLVFAAAIIEPIITIPQAILIFQSETAEGISLSTWVGYQLLTMIWIWWAIVHKEKIIIIYQGLFFIIQGVVIAGGIIYGAGW